MLKKILFCLLVMTSVNVCACQKQDLGKKIRDGALVTFLSTINTYDIVQRTMESDEWYTIKGTRLRRTLRILTIGGFSVGAFGYTVNNVYKYMHYGKELERSE
jgi:hypothetical protein